MNTINRIFEDEERKKEVETESIIRIFRLYKNVK